MRTFIRWQGNKTKHLNKFIDLIPKYTGRYIEPFLGSGSLLLKLEPEEFIINDINKDLYNTWECIRDQPEQLIESYKTFGEHFKELSNKDKVSYCKSTTLLLNDKVYSLERASDYLLMKHCCFTGDIFSNHKFYFGGLDRNIYINNRYYFLEQNSLNNICSISKFLKQGQLLNKSYEEILYLAEENDFVFLDPPYVEDKRYCFNYNENEVLDNNFLYNLKLQLERLDSKSIKWLMTQADDHLTRTIFNNYNIREYSVYRRSSKKYIKELAIYNYQI
jgi:DNA adenine methylase